MNVRVNGSRRFGVSSEFVVGEMVVILAEFDCLRQARLLCIRAPRSALEEVYQFPGAGLLCSERADGGRLRRR